MAIRNYFQGRFGVMSAQKGIDIQAFIDALVVDMKENPTVEIYDDQALKRVANSADPGSGDNIDAEVLAVVGAELQDIARSGS